MSETEEIIIEKLEVKDLRFPTSLQHDGSDAMVQIFSFCAVFS